MSRPGVVHADDTDARPGNGDHVERQGERRVESARERLDVGTVGHVLDVGVQVLARQPQVLGRGDDEIGPAGELPIVGLHHVRVDEPREGGVLVDAVVDQGGRPHSVEQRDGGGEVGPQERVPHAETADRPADVSPDDALVEPVDERAYVAERQERGEAQGPDARLGPTQLRPEEAVPAPVRRDAERSEHRDRFLDVEHPVGGAEAMHDLLLAGPRSIVVEGTHAHDVAIAQHQARRRPGNTAGHSADTDGAGASRHAAGRVFDRRAAIALRAAIVLCTSLDAIHVRPPRLRAAGTLQALAVGGQSLFGRPFDRELSGDAGRARGAQAPAGGRVAQEQGDLVGQRGGDVGPLTAQRHEVAGVSVDHGLGDAARVGGDHGQPQGHGFDDRERHAALEHRREHEDIDPGEGSRHVIDPPGELHGVGQARVRRRRLRGGAVRGRHRPPRHATRGSPRAVGRRLRAAGRRP